MIGFERPLQMRFRGPARRRYRVGSIHISDDSGRLEALFFPQFTCPRDSSLVDSKLKSQRIDSMWSHS